METDGRRTAKLKSQDVIDFVEWYAKEKHVRMYEAVEEMVRFFRDHHKEKTGEPILSAEVVGEDYMTLVDAMLYRNRTVTVKRIDNGKTKVVVR